jgi:hypothetical protein
MGSCNLNASSSALRPRRSDAACTLAGGGRPSKWWRHSSRATPASARPGAASSMGLTSCGLVKVCEGS